MGFRTGPDRGTPIPRLFVYATVAAGVLGSGCTRDAIKAARKLSTLAYQEQLRTIPAASETPEQAAQTQALREKLLQAEWAQRGYRVGNDKGGDTILYTALSRGLLGGLWYPIQLIEQSMSYGFGGDRPNRAAALMESGTSADARRRGINDLVRWDFALGGPYVKRYRQIAARDADPLVRATAIRALSRARDPEARALFMEALRDPATEVKLEAAKALNNLPDSNATGPLIRLLANADEDKDVRIAAAEALRHYKSLEVAQALIPRVSDHEFAIAWQARRSLRRITGRDLKYDEAGWLAFISGPEKPFG